MSSLLNSLDMSLDDLIAKKKETKSNGNKGGSIRGRKKSGPSSGPTRRKRTSNTSTRRARRNSAPYSRRNRSNDDVDMEDDEGEEDDQQEDRTRINRSFRNKKGSIFSRLGSVKTKSSGTKILVKNLKYDVLEDDINELFGTVGQVKKSEIVYDRTGRSTGEAHIWFARRSDAEAAVRQYDGRTLDEQVMKVEMEGSFQTTSSNQRSRNGNGFTFNGKKNVKNGLFGTALQNDEDDENVNFSVTFGNGQRRRGGGRGRSNRRGGGRGGRGSGRKQVTAEDLDAEMDNYMNDA